MTRSNITYVDPRVLQKVESTLQGVLDGSHASGILLIDSSGAVLASRGELPMHPDQIGAVAAGMFGAMKTMIKATRADEFIVRMPQNGMNLQFHHVDKTVFLCAFYADPADESSVRAGMTELAAKARNTLTEDQTAGRRMGSVSFIEEKLNEIFGQ